MKIYVGTKNAGKIEAVRIALGSYPDYAQAEVVGSDVKSGVKDQPIDLEEIITGAKNRALAAFRVSDGEAKLGIGLESGIFQVPFTKTGYMDTSACAIFDGQEYHIGLSSCFEYPKEMTKQVMEGKKDISQVALEMGFTEDPAFRESKGMIGILTKGVVSRIQYSEQGVHMAMIHLLNSGHY